MDPLAAQRRRASVRGNEVKSRRATVKRRIAAGELEIGALLDPGALADPLGNADDVVLEIRVGELLRSVPGIGEITAKEILAELEIPSDRRLIEVDASRQTELAGAIERSTA